MCKPVAGFGHLTASSTLGMHNIATPVTLLLVKIAFTPVALLFEMALCRGSPQVAYDHEVVTIQGITLACAPECYGLCIIRSIMAVMSSAPGPLDFRPLRSENSSSITSSPRYACSSRRLATTILSPYWLSLILWHHGQIFPDRRTYIGEEHSLEHRSPIAVASRVATRDGYDMSLAACL